MSSRRWRIAAGAAALVIALAACGGGGTATTSGLPDRDATLRATTVLPPPPLDPHTPASEVAQTTYLSLVYDRLTQMKAGPGGAELAPMVASSWQFSPDGKQLTFRLRSDVTFADGTVLDAAAVKQSLDRAFTLPKSTAKNYLSAIGTVAAPDPTTIVITTTRPAADLPYLLSTGFGSIINPKALNNADLDVNPQGSGPYTITNYKQGDSVTYERRAGYWDPDAAKVKTIVIRGIPDPNARISDLRSGQSDLTLLQPQQFTVASSLGSGFRIVKYPTIGTRDQVSINQFRPFMADVRVRQALNHAIDRKAIIDRILAGQATPLTQALGDSEDGHLATPDQTYDYDPDRARQLLREAGVPEGYELKMVSFNYAPVQDIAKVVQDQLGKVGLKVTIEYRDPLQAITGFTKDSAFDLSQNVSIAYETPRLTLANTYLSSRTLANPTPPALLDALGRAGDPSVKGADRTTLLQAANSSITDGALSLFLAGESTMFLTNDKVVGADAQARSNYQGVFDLRYVGKTG